MNVCSWSIFCKIWQYAMEVNFLLTLKVKFGLNFWILKQIQIVEAKASNIKFKNVWLIKATQIISRAVP